MKGLQEAIGKDGVCSNYAYDSAEDLADGAGFQGRHGDLHQPPTPIKCAGAPQKIMYLADSHFRRAGRARQDQDHLRDRDGRDLPRGEVRRHAGPGCERKGIERRFKDNLVELRPEQSEARFVHLDTEEETTSATT